MKILSLMIVALSFLNGCSADPRVITTKSFEISLSSFEKYYQSSVCYIEIVCKNNTGSDASVNVWFISEGTENEFAQVVQVDSNANNILRLVLHAEGGALKCHVMHRDTSDKPANNVFPNIASDLTIVGGLDSEDPFEIKKYIGGESLSFSIIQHEKEIAKIVIDENK